ncbi:hypothetical protein NIES22_48620 [Calothrix brevissima NIES-22]|nr:hypothetical protein NIES22_48620 [Calothrix brevissima NIES-22]
MIIWSVVSCYAFAKFFLVFLVVLVPYCGGLTQGEAVVEPVSGNTAKV